MTANGRHLKLSGRRGTPPHWVEMSRVALGGRIELDPMSEPAFNQIVKAERIFTAEDDCFRQDWRAGTLLINPPGGCIARAWQKLVEEYEDGRTGEAIWIGFSMEQLNLLAGEKIHPMDYSMLVVRDRIDFLTTELTCDVVGRDEGMALLSCGHQLPMSTGKDRNSRRLRCSECEGAPTPMGSPTHANYVVGIGVDVGRFERAFAGRGKFAHGRLSVHAESFGAP